MRNLHYQCLLLLCAIWTIASPAWALTDAAQPLVPNAALVGEGKHTVLFWDVYKAELYAPSGEWDENRPYALTLYYLQPLKGEAIASRAIEEMQRIGMREDALLDHWYLQLKALLPDVTPGTVLTGVHVPGEATHFYQDGLPIGSIYDVTFGHYFFNIWLSERTSAPELRQQRTGVR